VPINKIEGGLNLLHKADDDAVIWAESTVTAAVTKLIITHDNSLNDALTFHPVCILTEIFVRFTRDSVYIYMGSLVY